jgi:methenyltetrahydromethanopterin cyclohydrolase
VKLNELGLRAAHDLASHAELLNVAHTVSDCGTQLIDCGVKAAGGLGAGRAMAQVCLAGLGSVEVGPGQMDLWRGPWINVTTDQPLWACMASQYAGWPLNYEAYFAMGSGPMRVARGREPLLEKIGIDEQPARVVGVLESAELPPDDVCRDIARQCCVEPENVTLLVARTSSIAGTIQIVARSVETALHKLFELGFELSRVRVGAGTAPLPPVAGDDLTGIGRTNDAMLYGARVTLWVSGDDQSLREIGPRVPSQASPDHGRPFVEVFEHYQRDFYRIDPHLFSPAEIHFVNLDTGSAYRFGQPEPHVLQQSFLGQ